MCTQLGDEGLFGHGAGLLAALGVDVLRHLGAEGALALGVGGAVFVTVAAVYFKLACTKPVYCPTSSGGSA